MTTNAMPTGVQIFGSAQYALDGDATGRCREGDP
jgi:hypothetical protein